MQPIVPLLQAVGKIPSGLFVITAGMGPNATATLVSLVQQVSLEPLYVAVGVHHGRALGAALRKAKSFVINIIHAGDKILLRKYAKGNQEGDLAFADMAHRRLDTGNSILLDACAYIECELATVLSFGGDHELFVGRAVAGDLLGDGHRQPTVHIRHDGSKY